MRITRSLTASTARSRRHYARGGIAVVERRLSSQTTPATTGDRAANQTSIAPTSRSAQRQRSSPSRQHHSSESTAKRQTRRLSQARQGKRKEEKDEDGNESVNGETAPTRNSVRSSTRRISATNFFAPMISFATREAKRQRVAGTDITPIRQRPQISSPLRRKNPPLQKPQPHPNHRHGGGSVSSSERSTSRLTLGAALQSVVSRQLGRRPPSIPTAKAAALSSQNDDEGASRMPRRRTSLRLATTAAATGTAFATTSIPTDSTSSGCRHRYPLRPQQQQHQHDAPVATASCTSTRPSTTCNNDAALLELATRIVNGRTSSSAAAPGAVDGAGGMKTGPTNRCGRRSLPGSPSSPPLVVWITGAGLSVASGIRPFRTTKHGGSSNNSSSQGGAKGGIWDEVLWTMATREAFRKHPADWYRRFWNVYRYFCPPTTTPQCASREDETVTTFIRRHSTGHGESYNTSRGGGWSSTTQPAATASAGQNEHEPQPNAGHVALNQLMQSFDNCRHVTQNIDGLSLFGSSSGNGRASATAAVPTSETSERLVEVHGRAGLFKCCPEEDSSSSDDDSEDESDGATGSTSSNGNGSQTFNRQRRRLPIELGNRRKFRRKQQQLSPSLKRRQQQQCPYQFSKVLTASQLVYRNNRQASKSGQDNGNDDDGDESTVIPLCPECRNAAMPLALLFDEPYHSHTFYQFDVVEDWIAQADVIVFCGTSFAPVLVTQVALQHARLHDIPIYNFNVVPMASASLSATSTGAAAAAYTLNTTRLNVTDIVGPAEVTLPKLLDHCLRLQRAQQTAT